MTIKLGVVMDPLSTIHYKKDSTLAMLWAAEDRGWTIEYMEQKDLFLRDGKVWAEAKRIEVYRDPKKWFEIKSEKKLSLSELDVILMRKDPPYDQEYIYTTHLLDQAEREGVLVVNKPQSLRDANEKLFTMYFPDCSPPTLVTREKALLHDFFKEQKDIVCKPLEGMGGASVFRLKEGDENASVVFEVLTHQETRYAMAQRFIPEIKSGDKRILMIDGEPEPYALARIPKEGELRGNLAAGAKGVAHPLTERDRWIANRVGPILREKGLLFVGLDVIGDYLTEINVTSPTCIRELEDQCGLKIADHLIDVIEKKLKKKG